MKLVFLYIFLLNVILMKIFDSYIFNVAVALLKIMYLVPISMEHSLESSYFVSLSFLIFVVRYILDLWFIWYCSWTIFIIIGVNIIVELDERFCEERNRAFISKWLRRPLRVYDNFDGSLEGLKSFFENAKVYDALA
jgi:predicted membrane protein